MADEEVQVTMMRQSFYQVCSVRKKTKIAKQEDGSRKRDKVSGQSDGLVTTRAR
jgi:hypothetical protein